MKQLRIFLIGLTISGCMSKNYPLTTFYVKNNTTQTINFKATVLKISSMGPFDMTVPFTVMPQDSVLARRVNYKKDASPNEWFSQFLIFPVEGITFNDPNDASKWIKSTDENGKLFYTFTLGK